MDYDTLLHPHRFAVAAALSKGNATVEQLRSQLPHISQASLYRAIQKLEQSRMITKVKERQIRGTVEVTYGMGFSLSQMTMPDHAGVEQFKQSAHVIFYHYVMRNLERHQEEEAQQLQKARFNAVPLTLPEEQYDAFIVDVRNLIAKYMNKGQNSSGASYQLTTFLVPDKGDD
ncbi:winged helix-turn-helix transcriptional regulator [Paenibacillus sp. 22594]|uniref:winged helix-turn-helix transcriptional regulator n=1 Tax=Paenibacillus sp. 22594 TaxID=3453947 RepID=UPI003F838C0B